MNYRHLSRSMTWLLVLSLLTTGYALAQTRLTLVIECGDQGQVDQLHKLTVTVTNCTTNADTTVVIPIQAQTETSAIADTTARALSKKGVTGTTSAETTNNRIKSSPHKAEDIVLPKGYKVKSVKVEKKPEEDWQCDDGHLQAFLGKEKISKGNGKGKTKSARKADAFTSSVSTSYHWMDIQIVDATWTEPTLVLDLYGPEHDDGSQPVHTFEQTFPTGTSTAAALQELGAYLEDLGMVVLYPSETHLMIDIAASGLSIVEGYFSAQVTELSPIGSNPSVDYSFDLQ